MRAATVVLVMLLGVPGCGSTAGRKTLTAGQESADAQRVQAEVRGTISRTVAARQQAFAETSLPMRGGAPSAWYEERMAGLVVEDDLLRLARLSTDPDPQHEKSMASVYLCAVESEMRSPDPMVRGVACQVVGLTGDPRAIPAVGGLIDDTAESAPMSHSVVPQAGPLIKYWTQPTVGEIARASLHALTSAHFRTRADFDAWWKVNGNYRERLWYWATRWSSPPISRAVQAERGPRSGGPDGDSRSPNVKADLETLSNLPGDLGLKMLLLYRSAHALQTEAELTFDGNAAINRRNWRSRVHTGCIGPDDRYAPSLDAKAEYIREHGLKPRLVELLWHRVSYPEVAGPSGFQELALEIARVGEKVFTSEDEPVLAAIQRSKTGYPEVVQAFVVLRSRIAPTRGRAILRDALRENRRLTYAAVELIRRFGAADTQVLKDAFAAESAYSRLQMAREVEGAVKRSLPVSLTFIADLAEMLEGPTDPRDYSHSEALSSLARAANQATGQSVISDREIDALKRRTTKGPESEEMRTHNSQIPEAFRSVKAKLIAAVRGPG